jgi:hypothetical protein
MRTVTVTPPSFPDAPSGEPLAIEPGRVWQVLCGDDDHWRAGVYSPAACEASELPELERHDCPELFLLLSGRLTLVCHVDGAVRELALQPNRPVLITAPHSGYCPDGPHTGSAFVVERDRFSTEYREPDGW